MIFAKDDEIPMVRAYQYADEGSGMLVSRKSVSRGQKCFDFYWILEEVE